MAIAKKPSAASGTGGRSDSKKTNSISRESSTGTESNTRRGSSSSRNGSGCSSNSRNSSRSTSSSKSTSSSCSTSRSSRNYLEEAWRYILLCVALCFWEALGWEGSSCLLILLDCVSLSCLVRQLRLISVMLLRLLRWRCGSCRCMRTRIMLSRAAAIAADQETRHDEKTSHGLASPSCASGPRKMAFVAGEAVAAHTHVKEAEPLLEEAERTTTAITRGTQGLRKLQELRSRRRKPQSTSRLSLRGRSVVAAGVNISTHRSSPWEVTLAADASSLSRDADRSRHHHSTGVAARGQTLSQQLLSSEPRVDLNLRPRSGPQPPSCRDSHAEAGLRVAADHRCYEASSSAPEIGDVGGTDDTVVFQERRFLEWDGGYLSTRGCKWSLITAHERQTNVYAVDHGWKALHIARAISKAAARAKESAIKEAAAFQDDEMHVQIGSRSLSPYNAISVAKVTPVQLSSSCFRTSCCVVLPFSPPDFFFFFAAAALPAAGYGVAGSNTADPAAHSAAAGSSVAPSAAVGFAAAATSLSTVGDGPGALRSLSDPQGDGTGRHLAAGSSAAASRGAHESLPWHVDHYLCLFCFFAMPLGWLQKGVPPPSPPSPPLSPPSPSPSRPPSPLLTVVTDCLLLSSQRLSPSGPPRAGLVAGPACSSGSSFAVFIVSRQQRAEVVLLKHPTEGLFFVAATKLHASLLLFPSVLWYARIFLIHCSWYPPARSLWIQSRRVEPFFSELLTVCVSCPNKASSLISSSACLTYNGSGCRFTWTTLSHVSSLAVSQSLRAAAYLRFFLFLFNVMFSRPPTHHAVVAVLRQRWEALPLPSTILLSMANASQLATEQSCLPVDTAGDISAAAKITRRGRPPGRTADPHGLPKKSSPSSRSAVRSVSSVKSASPGDGGHAGTPSNATGSLRCSRTSSLALPAAALLSCAAVRLPEGINRPPYVGHGGTAHQARGATCISRDTEAVEALRRKHHLRPPQSLFLDCCRKPLLFNADQYARESAAPGELPLPGGPLIPICLFSRITAVFGRERRGRHDDNGGCAAASLSSCAAIGTSPALSSSARGTSYSERNVWMGVSSAMNAGAALVAEALAVGAVVLAARAAMLLIFCVRRQGRHLSRAAALRLASRPKWHESEGEQNFSRASCGVASGRVASSSSLAASSWISRALSVRTVSSRLLQRQRSLSLRVQFLAFVLCCWCPCGTLGREMPSYLPSPSPSVVFKTSVNGLDVHSGRSIDSTSPSLASANTLISTKVRSLAAAVDAGEASLFSPVESAFEVRRAATAAAVEAQQQPQRIPPEPPAGALEKPSATSFGGHLSSVGVGKTFGLQGQLLLGSSLFSSRKKDLPSQCFGAAAAAFAPSGRCPSQRQRRRANPTPAGIEKFKWPGAASRRQLGATQDDLAAIDGETESYQGALRNGKKEEEAEEAEVKSDSSTDKSPGGARLAADKEGKVLKRNLPIVQRDYSERVGGAAGSRRKAEAPQTLNLLDVLLKSTAPGESLFKRRMLGGLSSVMQQQLLATAKKDSAASTDGKKQHDDGLSSGGDAAGATQQQQDSLRSGNQSEDASLPAPVETPAAQATAPARDVPKGDPQVDTQKTDSAAARTGDIVETPQQSGKTSMTSTLSAAASQPSSALNKPEAMPQTSPLPPSSPAGDAVVPTKGAAAAATPAETVTAIAAVPTSSLAALVTNVKADFLSSSTATPLVSAATATASPKAPGDATSPPPPPSSLKVRSREGSDAAEANPTAEKSRPDPVEVMKEELQALMKTPQAAVVVPAVLQQEVDADQQLVHLTIPLLPSMRLATQSSGPSSSEGALVTRKGDGREDSVIFFKKKKASSSSEDFPGSKDGKEDGEQEGEPGHKRHADSRKEASQQRSNSSGAAGETLEEMSSNEKEMVISTGLLTLLVVLAVSLVLAHASRKCRLDWLQMPVCATLLGLVVGAALKFWLKVKGPLLDTILAMNEDVFFVMLLPPIIFEGGLGLSEGSFSVPFMRNFGAIMWLACFCTIVSFCWVGCVMFFAGQLRLSLALTVRQAFAFGALISSTDPVSVLALFKELHAKRFIHVLVFGESLLNDAISIVLYRTVASEENTSVGAAILAFFLTFFISLLVGLAVGLFCALTYKYMDLHKEENQILESALLLIIPWIAYLVADGAGYSGIVAICFCGVAVGKYAFPNLSAAAQATSRSVFTCFSLLAETVVFVFLGLAVFSFNQEAYTFRFGLYAIGFIATFTARGISIYVTCLIINFFRTSSKITGKHQLALALCGLRGAIAFALSERASHDFGGREGAALLSLTLYLALFTILVLGPSLVVILDFLGIFESRGYSSRSAGATGSRRMQYLKNKFGISRMEDADQQSIAPEMTAADEIELCSSEGSSMARREGVGGSDSVNCTGQQEEEDDEESLEALTRGTCGSLKRMLLHIDERYMVPLFTHSDNRHEQQRPVPPQLLQQQSKEGGMLLCEKASRRRRASGSQRRSRFSPAAIGRLAHLRRRTQDSESSLPTVAFSGFRLRAPRDAAFVPENRRRSVSQQSGSSGRCSHRSAASAPPGRLTQHSFVFAGGSSKECSHSPNMSSGSSNSTDIERGSAQLLRQGHSRSNSGSSSNNIRVRSCRESAVMTSKNSSQKTVLLRCGFPSPSSATTARELKLTANSTWYPQQTDQLVDGERQGESVASCDISVARQENGLRSGLLSWTSSQLRRVSRGIFSNVAVGADVSHSTRGGSVVADPEVPDIESEGGGHPERHAPAAASLVAENEFRRGGAGARSSGRGLQYLGSGANAITSSAGPQANDFSGGRPRRRTYSHYAASFRRQQQARYQPLQQQVEQAQQLDNSNIRASVEPVVLGKPRYGTESNERPPCGEASGAAAISSTGCALSAGALAAERVPPANPALQGNMRETMTSLPRLVPDTFVSKSSLGEDTRGVDTEDEVKERIKEREATSIIAEVSAGHAAATQTFQKPQVVIPSLSRKSLDRSAEDHEIRGYEADGVGPQPPVRPPVPPVLQQQLMLQKSQELPVEKAQLNVEGKQEAEQSQRCSQGGEWQHFQQHEQQKEEQPQWLEASRIYVADRHSLVPEIASERFDPVTSLQQQGGAALMTAMVGNATLPSIAATSGACVSVAPVTTLGIAGAVASEAADESITRPVSSRKPSSAVHAPDAYFNNVLYP